MECLSTCAGPHIKHSPGVPDICNCARCNHGCCRGAQYHRRRRVGDEILLTDGRAAKIVQIKKGMTGEPTIAVEVTEHFWITREEIK